MNEDKLDDYFDKWWNGDNMHNDKTVFKIIGGFWVAALLFNLAFWGVVVWAIITLVNKA